MNLSKTAAPLGLALVLASGPLVSRAGSLQGENLLLAIPNGFQIAKQGEQGPMIGAEYVPQGQTVTNWSRMVTVQVFRNMKAIDPDQFADQMRRSWLAACPGSNVQKIKNLQENGYPVSLWVFACPLNAQTGKPENMFAKFIGGADAFYSIQYAYRTDLTKDIIPPAMAYLGGVRVCDTRIPDRSCPSTAP